MSLILIAALAQAQTAPPPVSPMIADIIAGYHAWDLSCEPNATGGTPAACSTQASDQVTTIRLRRTTAGLDLSLGSRQCGGAIADARTTLSAGEVQSRRRRHDSERVQRVYGAFIRLEYQLLRSCGAADALPSGVYDPLLIKRFLEQSDAVVAGAAR